MIKKINNYLNAIQLVGFSILWVYIAYEVIKAKEGMGIVFLFLLALLFFPFISISVLALLDRTKHKEKLRVGLWINIFLLIIPALYSLLIIDKGGLVIASVLFISICATAALYKRLEHQLLMINVIATGILLYASGYIIMDIIDI